jgi:hypothetical protein
MNLFKTLAMVGLVGVGVVYGEDGDSSVVYQTKNGALELKQKIHSIINAKNLTDQDFKKALNLYSGFLELAPQRKDSPKDVNEIPECLRISVNIYNTLLSCVTGIHNLRTNENIKAVIDLADNLSKQLSAMKIPNYTAQGAGMRYSIAYGGDQNSPEYTSMMERLRNEDRKMRYQYAIQNTQWYLHRYFEMTLDRLKSPYLKFHKEGVSDQEWATEDYELYLQMVQMISIHPSLVELDILAPTKSPNPQ